MAKKKAGDPVKLPTNLANLSQNQDQRKKLPTGVDKRGGQSPK